MMHENPDPWATILAGSPTDGSAIRVRDYARMLKTKDREGISNLIRLRFNERYLNPTLTNPKRHGFAMLAIWCLMVEALESFRNGWKGTQWKKDACKDAFCGFFDAHDQFQDLRPVASEFFTHVRCGILHQAETTGNWTINRGSTLLSQEGGRHRLSAEVFGKRLRVVLNEYADTLAKADWRDPIWKNARKKFRALCRNCGLPNSDVKRLQ